MNVKRGSVVSHAMAKQWGIGKVVEVNDVRATIRFSDGMVRKIIASHFTDLEPADPASYQAPAKKAASQTKRASRSAPRVAKPKKKPLPKPKAAAAAGAGGSEMVTL